MAWQDVRETRRIASSVLRRTAETGQRVEVNDEVFGLRRGGDGGGG